MLAIAIDEFGKRILIPHSSFVITSHFRFLGYLKSDTIPSYKHLEGGEIVTFD